MSETIVDLNFLEAGVQCFPMYHYEERKIESKTLFDDAEDTIQNNYIRRDAISDSHSSNAIPLSFFLLC